MNKDKLIKLSEYAADRAKKYGANNARIIASRSREVSVEWRDGKLDRLQESTKQSLSVTLFVDGRYSVNETSDIREDSVDKFLENAIASTKLLAPDPHRRLPNPSRYSKVFGGDLEIFDRKILEIMPDNRLETARAIEESARQADTKNIIVSATGEVSDYVYETVCLNTNGLEAYETGTSTWRQCTAAIKDEEGKRPMGSAYGGGTRMLDLPSPSDIGKDALERAMEQIGSKQTKTGQYEILVENRAAPALSRHILGVLSGRAVQQRSSFLEDKLNKPVVSSALSVKSDPHLKGGLSSSLWDSEGMATVPYVIFDKGVLKTFFLDTYYASKLGKEPTSGSASNIIWQQGTRNAASIIKSIDKGIFITGFLGGNSNDTTGDFSLGIRGFLIKKGTLIQPISEMNLSGNHLDLWNNLVEIGSDPWPYSSNRTPCLRFIKAQCSGEAV